MILNRQSQKNKKYNDMYKHIKIKVDKKGKGDHI